MAPSSNHIAIVAGVGPGTGAAVAKRFAQKYQVVLLARKPENFESLAKEINSIGGKAIGISTDTTSAESVTKAFQQIKGLNAPVAAAVFNASGPWARKPFLEITADEFKASIEGSAMGGYNFSRAALPLLLEAVQHTSPARAAPSAAETVHPPTLIFTGATASIKGSARFSSFAAGKFALRALAQSLGREFGPQGVHVAHAVIDGVIDIPRTQMYDMPEDGKIDPAAIADQYWYLHTQPRTSFTFELDIRPFVEKW